MRIAPWVLLAFVAGCNSDGFVPDPEPDIDMTPEPDLSGPLYDPTRIVNVSISLPAADWNELRTQTRDASDIFGSCPSGPHPSPFTQFRATVTVDGTLLSDVAIRKKGFYGSLDDDRPSLKIKTDEYVKGQSFYGRKSLTLNNAKQDPSLVRQCLAYQVFANAGVPSSRCNFARVRVNGTDLGIYVNVEGVNKPMLRRHFTDDTGNLYEGAISDFRPGWTITFDKKTNESDPDRSDLDAMSTALATPDAGLLAAIDPLVDVEEFLDYWAAEILVGHTDSYSGLANNFLVYHDPTTGRFSFLPWGVDQTFAGAPAAVVANGLLARRLYLHTPTRDRYLARLRQHLETIWNETELIVEIDRMAALISAPPAEVEAVRQFVRDRRSQIETELAAGPPVWSAPFKANAKPCFESNGAGGGTFQTTWGTLGAQDVFASGTGTLTGTVENVALGSATNIGSTSGNDPDNGRAVIQMFALNPNGTITVVFFSVDPTAFSVGTQPIGFGAATAAAGVYLYTPSADTFESLGIVVGGTLQLEAASTTNGGQVRGRFDLSTLRFPF
jgi:spore coat protein H